MNSEDNESERAEGSPETMQPKEETNVKTGERPKRTRTPRKKAAPEAPVAAPPAAAETASASPAVALEPAVEGTPKAKTPGKESDEFSVEEAPTVWMPKTVLGMKVYQGEISSIKELMKMGLPVKEVGIIDRLMPGMKEEIVDIGRVQRVTDSGRRMRFRVTAVVGNQDGYVGIGQGKAKEVGPAIRKAIDKAKLSLREIKRGCGSWECGCGTPHTVPTKISGKSGSVTVYIAPAPKGVGLNSGEIVKKTLMLAGISDAWVRTSGHTRTGINFAYAVYNALVNTNYLKMDEKTANRLKIISGSKEA